MKISIDWLKDYIDIKESPQRVADALTMGIAEIEGVEEIGGGHEGIVVGEVLEKKKHPDADRLSVATVDIGLDKLTIVCGAQNLAQGQKVPVATIGTVMPDGMEIKEVNLRGVTSCGMISSEKELGLKDESDGIMVLDKNAKIGQKFKDYLSQKKDYILTVDNKSLTHRSDLFGHVGIARELSAILGKTLKTTNLTLNTANKKSHLKKLQVEVKDKNLCPRYMAVVLDNIEIKDSPEFIKNRLNACGVRSINNVVDITNYILLEYGQPLHAFDFDKLAGDKDKSVVVRLARKGEKITTIDGKQRDLGVKELVIADKNKAIAIAGVMGGADTEVDEKTKSLIIESANFDSFSIRKTSQRLGLRTEAVTRFEKGLSPEFAEYGMARSIELMQKYANASVASRVVDTRPTKPKVKEIKVSLEYLNKLIGVNIPKAKVVSILKSLDFRVSATAKDIKVKVPLYRMDIALPEDVIEEVARIYGYDNIEPLELQGVLKPVEQLPDLYWSDKISENLEGMGFTEVMNYSFVGDKLLSKSLLSTKDHIELENPVSEELKYLRTTLLPGLFKNAEKNIRNSDEFKLFEIGHVYFESCESKVLAGVIVGDKEEIFYDLKGSVELLLDKLGVKYKAEKLSKTAGCEYWNMYEDGKSLIYSDGDVVLGTLSLASAEVCNNFHLKRKKMAFFSFSLEQITTRATKNIDFKKLPKFPPITLDLALVIDKKIEAEVIKKMMLEVGKPLLQAVDLFDVFMGKQIGEDKKSLAYHLVYRSDERTLNDNEVKTMQEKIIKKLEGELGAKVR